MLTVMAVLSLEEKYQVLSDSENSVLSFFQAFL